MTYFDKFTAYGSTSWPISKPHPDGGILVGIHINAYQDGQKIRDEDVWTMRFGVWDEPQG